jgi:predicted MPP superfamily phosphohydrolase
MSEIRILVVSDIHYREEYEVIKIGTSDDSAFLFMWNKFVDAVINLKPTHIIINGDLLQKGDEAAAFKDYLETLYKLFTPDKVHQTPGNHDVMWSKLENIFFENKDIYAKLSTFLYSPDIKTRELKYPIFKGYEDLYKNLKKFIENQNSKNYSYNKIYTDDNIVFRSINSSVNSFGNANIGMIKGLLPNIKGYSGANGVEHYLLELMNDMVEFGTQYYEIPKFLETEKEFLKNNKSLVLSFAHHPVEALHYNQVYSTDDQEGINQLFSISSLHITSHEHIQPQNFKPYYIDNCLIIKTGKFSNNEFVLGKGETVVNNSQVHKHVFDKKDNWFTVLDISNDRDKLTQTNYLFNFDPVEIDNSKWDALKSREFPLYNKNAPSTQSLFEKANLDSIEFCQKSITELDKKYAELRSKYLIELEKLVSKSNENFIDRMKKVGNERN